MSPSNAWLMSMKEQKDRELQSKAESIVNKIMEWDLKDTRQLTLALVTGLGSV